MAIDAQADAHSTGGVRRTIRASIADLGSRAFRTSQREKLKDQFFYGLSDPRCLCIPRYSDSKQAGRGFKCSLRHEYPSSYTLHGLHALPRKTGTPRVPIGHFFHSSGFRRLHGSRTSDRNPRLLQILYESAQKNTGIGLIWHLQTLIYHQVSVMHIKMTPALYFNCPISSNH